MGMGPVLSGIAPISFEITGVVEAYHFVATANRQAGDGENTWGIAAHYGKDEPTTVETLGVNSVTAGAAISKDDLIQSDANGRAIPKVAGATVARALDDADAGEYVRVMLIQN